MTGGGLFFGLEWVMSPVEFERLADRAPSRARIIPVHRRMSADLLTPVSTFLQLRKAGSHPFLLESVEGGEKLARYSFLGADPYMVLRASGKDVTLEKRRSPADQFSVSADDPFTALTQCMDAFEQQSAPGLPRFTGGAVGYLAYDCVRHLERLPRDRPDSMGLPDAVWCFYDRVVAFDHLRRQVVIVAQAFLNGQNDRRGAYEQSVRALDELAEMLRRPPAVPPESIRLTSDKLTSNMARGDFETAVKKTQRYVREGDIFQAVLSQRFSLPYEGDRFNLYRSLRQVNPSPYLFFLDMDDFALAGSSPEVLVRVEDGRAELLPIAGTRPRGETPQEDAELEDELLADAKERAEHLMLVDLGRNDLGRVCRFGSVKVDDYAYIERYSHVMHIVSAVTGEVAAAHDAMDVLKACFPAGTVSGAPKVRAMEIIDELEPSRRGVYAGAVGYLDFSGNLDTCIAIRTMVVRNGTIHVQAGAGIVADSDPAVEYDETVNKARALQEAIRMAGQGLL